MRTKLVGALSQFDKLERSAQNEPVMTHLAESERENQVIAELFFGSVFIALKNSLIVS